MSRHAADVGRPMSCTVMWPLARGLATWPAGGPRLRRRRRDATGSSTARYVSQHDRDQVAIHALRETFLFLFHRPARHPHVATLQNNLADVLRGMGEYSAAKILFERGVDVIWPRGPDVRISRRGAQRVRPGPHRAANEHFFADGLKAGYAWIFPPVDGIANIGVYQRRSDRTAVRAGSVSPCSRNRAPRG